MGIQVKKILLICRPLKRHQKQIFSQHVDSTFIPFFIKNVD